MNILMFVEADMSLEQTLPPSGHCHVIYHKFIITNIVQFQKISIPNSCMVIRNSEGVSVSVWRGG